MVATRRRDWFTILRHLAKAGVSMSQVARKCNRNNTTVAAWANGSEPKESDARIVLALYAKWCPRQYLEHQKEFEISVEIDAVTEPGETRVLPFVG
jgi:sulfite reductase beta subunit-like hemoprotein